MKTFLIEASETVFYKIPIEAETQQEAEDKILDMDIEKYMTTSDFMIDNITEQK
jgi:hypothetical protein